MSTKITIRCFAVLTIFCLAAIPARAQQQEGVYKLQHRSMFFASDADHNPFWPIGWAKSTTVSDTIEVADIRPEDFKVTSILLGNLPQAVINGRGYAERDFIVLQLGGQKVKVQVARIEDGQVILLYLNREYKIPMRQPAAVKAVESPTPME